MIREQKPRYAMIALHEKIRRETESGIDGGL